MNEPNPVHHLDPSCPWYPLKAIRLPQVKWCEDQWCGWIEEPANTWSNLGYVFFGFLMIAFSRNLKSRALRFYGPAAMIVGACSFIYHASNAFVLQVFDFFGMYLYLFLLFFVNLERMGKRPFHRGFAPYLGLVTGITLLTVAIDFTSFPIQGLIFFMILAILIQEGMLYQHRSRPYSMKWFFFSALFMGLAATCSILDVKRIACDPDNHVLQGHAAWHVLGSISLFFSFLHHRQFDAELSF